MTSDDMAPPEGAHWRARITLTLTGARREWLRRDLDELVTCSDLGGSGDVVVTGAAMWWVAPEHVAYPDQSPIDQLRELLDEDQERP